jgi:DNA-binding SARP family transcriptional activator/tetratricopeptide (TPR) repeat protein
VAAGPTNATYWQNGGTSKNAGAGVGMEFRVLGPVEVRSGEHALAVGHPRQRAVLAVLLLEAGRVVPADLLIDRVWGEDPPASVRNVLSGYVARLKAVIGGANDDSVWVSRRHGGYLLHAQPDLVDVHRFRDLVAAAGDEADDRAQGLLRDALALWQGPALAGLESPWLNATRHTLELERHAAVLDLNDVRLRQGEQGGLIGDLTGQVAAAPADERLIGQLMLALYRCGRQTEALRQFDQARRFLADELGADPGPPLRTLHEQILNADPALAPPSTSVGNGQPADQVPHQLPADVSAFTGRAGEIAALDEFLLPVASSEGTAVRASTAAVICAVSGTAGVGKTALAVRWAHRAAAQFPDGQLYVNLRGYDPDRPVTAADALAGFLRALGVPGQAIPSDEEERAARYRSLLAGRRMLVVLDNAASVDQVRPLLPGTPGCAVLVTSRDSLAGLVARHGARRIDLDLLPLPDAVSLLGQLIGLPAAADPDAVATLAGLCARLPLALRVAAELAATRPAETLGGLVAEVRNEQARLDLLDAGGDPRTSVRAVFSWSLDALDAGTARVFRLACLHPAADFEPWAVAALAGTPVEQVRRQLSDLNRAHLIQSAAPGRYGMHDLLRAYARDLAERREGEEEMHAATSRMNDHYLNAAAVAMNAVFPAERDRRPPIEPAASAVQPMADSAAALAWLDAELAALIAVTAHAAEHGRPRHAIRMAATLARYLDSSARYVEARSLHGFAYWAACQVGDRAAEGRALNGLGAAAFCLAGYDVADDLFCRAADLFRETTDRASEGRALHNLGWVRWGQGRYQAAADLFQQELTLFRETGDRGAQAGAVDGLGVVAMHQGHYDVAVGYHRQALSMFDDAGDRRGAALSLANLGAVCDRQGHHQQALGYYEQAMALFRQVGERANEARMLANIGRDYHQQGRFQDAADHLTRALEFDRDSAHQWGEIKDRIGLGDVLLAVAQPGQARAHYAAALGQAVQIGDMYEQARAHDGLGQACDALGDDALARSHWQQALELFAELGAPEYDEVRVRLAAATAGAESAASE